jgi:multidrug efflux system outer membrane protein
MKRILATTLCFILLLPGCAVGPDYERPMVDTPSAWSISPEEAADTANTACGNNSVILY